MNDQADTAAPSLPAYRGVGLANMQRTAAPIRLLQVEDNPLDAELVLNELEADGLHYEARLVEDEPAYLVALDEFKPDIVLSDLSLPGFSGQRALELLRKRTTDVPFIFVSGALGEEAAIAALRNGATDYILKQNPARLASAVRRALAEARTEQARRYNEAEIIRAQRFESLAMLAGGLSHDLRNLLQPLLLAGDSLQDYQDDPRLARLGALVRECGRRGLQMVQSMLSFARGSRHAEQVRLVALLDALGLLLRGSVPGSIKLQLEVEDDELTFSGNYTELQQCLLNLCLNAIQAMPDGGELRIEATQVVLPDHFFLPGEEPREGRYLHLAVADTGPGMAPDVLQRLFEPFFTTKESGTGLGLLSCKRIIASHGGVMRVHSALGQGTRFTLYLPLDEEAAAENDEQALDPANLQGEGERVLVVVEEAAQLSLLIDMLQGYGYDAHASQSGTAALQWIGAFGLPDIVVMDADMNLFTGVRTLSALIEQGYQSAVVMLARADAPPDRDELPGLKHLYLLEKPVSTGRLLQTIQQALAARAKGGAAPG